LVSYIKKISEKKISRFTGICYQCDFCVNEYSDSNVKYLLEDNINELLDKAVVKRKSEFVAGRYLSRRALMSLGASNVSVGIGINREPLWPNSFIGSISHSEGVAICAVSHQDDSKRIGIDVEDFFNVKTARDIVSTVLIDAEYELVGTNTNLNPVILTLIFSAKESLFKALYPEVGHYFDFDAAEIKEINFQTGELSLRLVQKLTPNLPVGTYFQGTFEIVD